MFGGRRIIGDFGFVLRTSVAYMASGGSLIVSSAAQLVTFAVLARWLGVHEFSLFVAITAICSVALHLCGLGAMESLVRRVARDSSVYPVMLGHNLILTGITGVILVAAGAVILPFLFELSATPALNVLFITAMLVTNIVLVRLIVLTEQIFIGRSEFGTANKVVVGFALARTATAVLACILFGVSTTAEWAVWQFACHVLVVLVCFRTLLRLGRPEFRIVREEIMNGIYFCVPFILRAARQNVDLMVLSLVSTAEIVSSYSVARRMIESSYLSVEALNRLIYPGSARASAEGLHRIMERVKKVLFAATAISIAAAVAVYIIAPLLPYLFGHDYVSLVSFVRQLCWVVVFLAIWSVAVEALGAAGNHAHRGTVMSLGSLFGAALTAWATWYAPPEGTIISFYVIEFAMVVASWLVLVHAMRRSKGASADALLKEARS
ncbi:lipopolysaccharide biosynthesis protein [Chelativorans sp. AA-79]|uniref:lipopolysaccharide biosynthesis protein n=1 Tax=Chelativorans sp. AA-79 TaxID=3028735 RepID=UPI0023F74E22|nr:lipopolysaccharide biosynthesis protein [Chelativorans sp. AA-79]WEX10625.1 lipopolysaccharide biosynthesis protein [Chelativorans sp. AA-79]